jgi:hypothetical protein
MRIFGVILTAAFLLLNGCSEPPKPAAKKDEPKKEKEPLSGKNAFFKVYVAARSWSGDAQCISVSSIPMEEVKSQPGKSGAWQVTVFSPSKLKKRTYTWSAVESEGNLHEGVYPGAEESVNPNGKQKPFLIAALKIDTTEALKTAQEHSAEYMKRNPTMPINYLLELGDKHPNPAWRVIWGESVGTSGHSVFVDAVTGQYLETRH